MNLDKIRKQIFELKNLKLKIKLNIGRKKYEYYEGKIEEIYQNIFMVKTDKGLKSFTYADIVTRAVIISKFD